MAGSETGHAGIQGKSMSAVIEQPLLNFRPMYEEDLISVLEIENSAYAFPWSTTIFHDCLRVGYCCWVMECGENIVAYGVMSVNVGESHILNLCVDPQYQGLGYGTVILNYMLDIAKKHKAEMIFLEVRPSNFVAIRLYGGAGFNQVGMRRNYYPAENGREDALIMARSL